VSNKLFLFIYTSQTNGECPIAYAFIVKYRPTQFEKRLGRPTRNVLLRMTTTTTMMSRWRMMTTTMTTTTKK